MYMHVCAATQTYMYMYVNGRFSLDLAELATSASPLLATASHLILIGTPTYVHIYIHMAWRAYNGFPCIASCWKFLTILTIYK